MGAYLSSPSTEKKSEDFVDSKKFSYGVSLMQGWRISMEDAHCCVPDLSRNDSLFGVYDGHGGREVAAYCARHFGDILKSLDSYKEGHYEDALKQAFMFLDGKLLDDEVVRELKVLADRDFGAEYPTKEEISAAEAERKEEEECEEDEMAMLHEEATMSIEELLARYGKVANETKKKLEEQKNVIKAEGQSSESSGKKEESQSSSASSSKDLIEDKPTGSQSISSEVSSSSHSKEEAGSSEECCSSSDVSCAAGSSADADVSSSSSMKPEQSNEVSSSDSAKEESSTEKLKQASSPSNEKVSSSGKVRPKKMEKKSIKLGIGDDEDFEVDFSDSDEDDESDDTEDNSSECESESEEDEEESSEDEDENVGLPTPSCLSTSREEPGKDSGTTAVVALINKYELIVANAGDSRCVLCRDGLAFDMSEDHKPEDDVELKRITEAGGYVSGGRVNGGLNLSRAIGDHCYKNNSSIKPDEQIISAMPDVKKVTLKKGDKFMVLACDGIWNTLSSQNVVDFVSARLPAPNSSDETKLSLICEELMMACLAPDTTGDGTGCDNMTCIIVKFNDDWLAESPGCAQENMSSVIQSKADNGSGESVNHVSKVNGLESEMDSLISSSTKRSRTEVDIDNSDKEAKKPKIV